MKIFIIALSLIFVSSLEALDSARSCLMYSKIPNSPGYGCTEAEIRTDTESLCNSFAQMSSPEVTMFKTSKYTCNEIGFSNSRRTSFGLGYFCTVTEGADKCSDDLLIFLKSFFGV